MTGHFVHFGIEAFLHKFCFKKYHISIPFKLKTSYELLGKGVIYVVLNLAYPNLTFPRTVLPHHLGLVLSTKILKFEKFSENSQPT
jgi:hypothetical protein